MKREMRVLGLLAVFILVVGCTSTGRVAGVEAPIVIGWIGPLTGSSASFGYANLRGIELAVDEINAAGGIFGRPIKLVTEDDRLETKDAVNAFEKMVAQPQYLPVLIFSPHYSGMLALRSRAEQLHIPIMDSVDTSEELAQAGDNVFAVGIYDDAVGKTMADFVFTKLGKKDAGVLFLNNEEFYVLVKEKFVEEFALLGGRVRAEGYAAETSDFRAQLSKYKGLGIDTLVVLGVDEAGLALRQAREIGFQGALLFVDTATGEGFLKNAAGAEEGIYHTYWASDSPEKATTLEAKYQAKYHTIPDQLIFTATGYDAMQVAAAALRMGGTDGVKLNQALYQVKDIEGVSGTLTMSEDGIVRTIIEKVFRRTNGAIERVE